VDILHRHAQVGGKPSKKMARTGWKGGWDWGGGEQRGKRGSLRGTEQGLGGGTRFSGPIAQHVMLGNR